MRELKRCGSRWWLGIVYSLLVLFGVRAEARQLTWSPLAPLPTATARAAAGVSAGKLYLLGGMTAGGATAAVTVYDPASDGWQPAPALAAARSGAGTATLDGTVYLAGGEGSIGADSSIVAYQTGSGASDPLGSLVKPRSNPAAAILNNHLYIVGGVASGFDSIEEFNLGTGTGTVKTTLPGNRRGAAAVVIGSKIYIIGGLDLNGNTVNSCWEYDPVANNLIERATMPVAAAGKGAVVHNGRIYVVGGETAVKATTTWTPWVQEYDPATNSWRIAGALLASRAGAAIAILNNELFAVGGGNGPQAANYLAVNESAFISLAGNLWNSSGTMLAGISEVITSAAGTEQLALKADGTVWSWGTNNNWGEIGRSSDWGTPAPVDGPTGVTAIAAAAAQSAALAGDRSVWVWGFYGGYAPVRITHPDFQDIIAISAATFSDILGLKSDGTVWRSNRGTISRVPNLVNIRAIAQGISHGLAVDTNGTVWSWPDNVNEGLYHTCDPTPPTAVSGISQATQVTIGYETSFALKADGTVWTWSKTRPLPVQVAGLTDVIEISGNGVALKRDGTVWNITVSATAATATQVRAISGVVDAGERNDLYVIPAGTTPRIITTALPAGRVGNGYTYPLGASGGVLPYSWSVVSGNLPAGLTLAADTGRISGTPTASGTATISLRVTDNAGQTMSRSFSLTVHEPLVVSTAALPDGEVGRPYGPAQLVATGGLLPYTWSIGSGSLPPGLNLHATTGVISGTPATVGTFTLYYTVADALGYSSGKLLTITIQPVLTLPAIAPPEAHVARAYSFFVPTAGGVLPVSWSIIAGKLPRGLSLNSNGEISGYPVAAEATTISLQATDAAGAVATRSLTVTVTTLPGKLWSWGNPSYSNTLGRTINLAVPGEIVELAGVTEATIGYHNAVALRLDGTVWTWGSNTFGSLGRSGNDALPGQVPGMVGTAVSAGIDQTIILKPDKTLWYFGGYASFEGEQVAGVNNAKAVVVSDWYALILKEDGTVWQLYQVGTPVKVEGPTNIVAIARGDNSDDFLALADDGTVWKIYYNEPVVQVSGLDNVILIADGLAMKADRTVWNLSGATPVQKNIPTGTVVSLANQLAVMADGNVWNIAGTDPVPITGIGQVTTVAGYWYDSKMAIVPHTTTTLVTDQFDYATTGVAYTKSLAVCGGSQPYSCTRTSGTLPVGLSLNNCTVSGTPTTPGSATFTLQVADSGAVTDSRTYTFEVYDPLRITTATLPNGGVGTTYSATLTSSGAVANYFNWWLWSGSLPPGVSYSGSTGVISGTPTAAGTYYPTFRLNDGIGREVTQSFTIVVLGITNSSLANGQMGTPYSQLLTATSGGVTPYHWSIVGNLPPGLLLDPQSGLLLGMPTSAGTYSFTVQVIDSGTAVTTKAFTVTVAPAPAATGYRWTGLGPDGGSIWDLVVDRNTPGRLHAATYGGGVFGSSSGGTTWTTENGNLTNLYVRSLASDPANPNTLYAGTNGGMFKSLDGGQVWGQINSGINAYDQIQLVVPDPVTSAKLYAASNNYLYQSVDGGGNWSPVYSIYGVSALAINPATPAIIYAGTSGSGVYRSGNGGGSWSPVNTGLPYDYDGGIFIGPLLIDPSAPDTLYTTSSSTIYKTTNGGTSWSVANSGLGTAYVSRLAMDPVNPAILYATTSTGIYRSTNRAVGWSLVNGTVKDGGLIKVDPHAAGTLYTVTGAGLQQSLDSGDTWQPATSGLAASSVSALAANSNNGAVLAAIGGELRQNSGSGWNPAVVGMLPANISDLALDPATTTIYAAANGNVNKSVAGGAWTTMNNGLGGYYGIGAASLAINPQTPGTLYVGTYAGVYRTSDGGATWLADTTGFPTSYYYTSINALALASAAPATVYAAWYGSDDFYGDAGVYKRGSNGSWTRLDPALLNFNVNSLATTPDGTTVYAGNSSTGVYKSVSGGAWAQVNSGLSNLYVTSLLVDPNVPTTVYAGTNGGGVFKSTTSGASWSPLNEGLGSLAIQNLAMDPATAMLYAGTSGRGVFQLPTTLVITTQTLPTAILGTPYSQPIKAAGGRLPYSWAITGGSLPTGLTLDPVTGTVSGTPTMAGNGSVTIQVKDADNLTVSRTYTLAVLGITTSGLPYGTRTLPYNQTLTAAGGTAPYSWAITAGNLPPGLTLAATTGTISGKPLFQSGSSFTVTVTDSQGQKASMAYTVYINPGYDLAVTAVNGAGQGLVGGTVALSYTLLADPDGDAPCYYPIHVYLSTDGTLANARQIDGDGLGCGVTPGVPYQRDITVTIPADVAVGTYWWGVVLPGSAGGTNTSNDSRIGNQIVIGPDPTIPYTIDVAVIHGEGTITPSATTTYYGATVDITVTPAPGAAILNLTDNGKPVAGIPGLAGAYTYTLTNLDANHSIRAGFAAGPAPALLPLYYDYGRSSHRATQLPGGAVYLSGGYTIWGYPQDTAEVFDPVSGTFSPTGILENKRAFHTATYLADGRILLVGGSWEEAPTAETNLNGFTQSVGPPLVKRNWHTATLLPNSKVLIAGGLSDSGYVATAELFDPATDSFSYTGSMTKVRSQHTATRLTNGKVLIAGGNGDNESPASAELYDPNTGSFSLTGAMTTRRSEHQAIQLLNGKVLLAGGYAGLGGDEKTAEIYDPSTGTFSATGSMVERRIQGDATLLPDGRVLFVGGIDSVTTEIYDPSTGLFSAEGTFPLARSGFTATALPSGDVLVAGGNTTNGVLKSAVVIKRPTIGNAVLSGGTVGGSYSSPLLTVTNGVAPFIWTITSGSLPPGLTLDSGSGAISGIPTAPGIAAFTLKARDANGNTAIASSTISIADQLVITPPPTISCIAGTPCAIDIPVSGGLPPYACTISTGALPAGLNLTTIAGGCRISGTPSAAGTVDLSLQVIDANAASASTPLSISIHASVTIVTTSLPVAELGIPYSTTLTATGGDSTFSWAITSGSLPPGLNLDAGTGLISGTPTVKGTSPFTIQVVDGSGQLTSKSFLLTVKEIIYHIPELPGEFPSLQDAYNAMPDAGSLQLKSGELAEGLTLHRPIGIRLQGGYDGSFLANSGAMTTIGPLTIAAGTVTVDNIAIK